MEYINSPHEYVTQFVQKKVKSYMYPNRFHEVMRKQVENCIKHVKAALDDAAEKTAARVGSENPEKVWEDAFRRFLKDKEFSLH